MGQFSLIKMFGMGGLMLVSSCASPNKDSAEPSHGKLTEMSRVKGDIEFCSHKVPEKVCTSHHPELVVEFKRAGDWCAPHDLPESQCFECHPDLTFDPLPKLPPDADVEWLSKRGEDVVDLDSHAVAGKVTVFEFYAEWCASCRKVDGHIYRRLADGDRSIAYRKLNIVSWESDVAQRYMKDVPKLPYIVIYDKDGKKFATLHGAKLDPLDAAIADAAKE